MKTTLHWCIQSLAIWTVLFSTVLTGLWTPINPAAQTPSPDGAFELVVLGDMPYTTQDVDRDQAFTRLIAAINAVQPAFSIHVGDIKSGSTRCDDATFEKIKAYFMTLQQPLVYTPGDNEWTDCHRKSNGAFDPLERLAKLRALFFPQATSLGQQTLAVTRQSDVSAFTTMVEMVLLMHGEPNFQAKHGDGSGFKDFLEALSRHAAPLL